jgi:outer membrane protein
MKPFSIMALGMALCVSAAADLPAVAADGPRRLSLAECLRIAEEKHPDLAAARALVDAARAQVRIAQAGYKPHLDAGTSYTRQTYNYAAVPGTSLTQFNQTFNGEAMSPAPYYYAGLNLSQTIYDFGLTHGTIRRGEVELEAAQQNLRRVHDLVYLNVREAYYSVLAAEEILQARQDAVNNQNKHLAQVVAFHDVGRSPKIDVTRQEVALASAQVDLRQAQENHEVAKAALATAMGTPIDQAPEPLQTLGEVPEPESLEQLLAEAEQKRPDAEALRDQIYAAEADIIVARSYFRPNIVLASFFNYRNLKFPLIYNWSLAGLLAQNLLDGGTKRGRLTAAQAEEAAARANLTSLLQKIRQEVFTDYADMKVAKDKIQLNQKAVAEAKENLALAEGRYAAGYGNIIELTDAQTVLTNSEVQEIVSRYDYQSAAARLDVAVGRTPMP